MTALATVEIVGGERLRRRFVRAFSGVKPSVHTRDNVCKVLGTITQELHIFGLGKIKESHNSLILKYPLQDSNLRQPD